MLYILVLEKKIEETQLKIFVRIYKTDFIPYFTEKKILFKMNKLTHYKLNTYDL